MILMKSLRRERIENVHEKSIRSNKHNPNQTSWALCIAYESGYVRVFRGGKGELRRRIKKSLTPHKGYAYFVKITPKRK